MSFGSYVLADPQSKLNYVHDWTDFLAQGETMYSRQWSITPMNGTSPETPILVGDTTDTVFVSGLLAGRVYRLVEHVVTSAGVEDDRMIVIRTEDT